MSMRSVQSAAVALGLLVGLSGCGDEKKDAPAVVGFGESGSTSADTGDGSFTFGVATAATHIEDMNDHVDWEYWTRPVADGGYGQGAAYLGDAVQGYTRMLDDVELISNLGVDSYRFSMEWARIEPERDKVEEAPLQRYSDFIDALVEKDIEPMVTIHHFSNPLWVAVPGELDCADGPTDTNLCGWSHPEGGPLIIEELVEHAAMLAKRYGDRVDDWVTINEPVNYSLSSYAITAFPPGADLLLNQPQAWLASFKNLIAAHSAIYDAIKANDTVDADGDGVAASVGLSLNVSNFEPVNMNGAMPVDQAAIDATARYKYFYQELFPKSIIEGNFDADFDMVAEEDHPEWRGRMDWLGVQYYSRVGVTPNAFFPFIMAVPCAVGPEFGGCLPPLDRTKCVPSMNYEWQEEGVYEVLKEYSAAWPDLPMLVTESGIAATEPQRRSEHIVRSLEQIAKARDEGVDVRGYYHWTLMHNFEWAEGYGPKFGLYSVDRTTFERTPTSAVDTLKDITRRRGLTQEQIDTLGGNGPLTLEAETPAAGDGPICNPPME